MRTTLTIEPEVSAQLKKYLKETGLSLKSAINMLLRRGLHEIKKSPNSKKHSTSAHDAGELLIPDISNVGALMSLLDEKTK
jgi:hypothetical protein